MPLGRLRIHAAEPQIYIQPALQAGLSARQVEPQKRERWVLFWFQGLRLGNHGMAEGLMITAAELVPVCEDIATTEV